MCEICFDILNVEGKIINWKVEGVASLISVTTVCPHSFKNGVILKE